MEPRWRAWRDSPDESAAWNGDITFEARAARMWSPCHFVGQWSGADLQLSWIRRARDPWVAGEPPLEAPESYRVRVSQSGVTKRQWDSDAAAATYLATDQAADFQAGGVAVIDVAQLGPDGEPGDWTTLSMVIPAP